MGWYKFSASAENMTLLADTGDFFNLEGVAVPYRVLEVRVWQRGTTTLTMETLLLRRGVIVTPAGTAVTEREYNTIGPAPTVVARSLPTTDVATTDWEYQLGWNLLQESHFLPIPKLQVPVGANVDFGVAQLTGTAHTGVGVTMVWEEFIGT